MKLATHHHYNECAVCKKTAVRCTMFEDLEEKYFTNVCTKCEAKGDEYCKKKLKEKRS